MSDLAIITPSQLAFHQAAKERALRKLQVAKLNRQQPVPLPIDQTIRAPEADDEQFEADHIIPDDFETHATVKVKWVADYSAYPFAAEGQARSMAQIAAVWLEVFRGVSVAEIRGAGRSRRVVFPRQVIWHAIKTERLDLSYPQVGRWMGGRDHTTGLHSFNKIQAMIDAGTFDAEVEEWQRLFAKVAIASSPSKARG